MITPDPPDAGELDERKREYRIAEATADDAFQAIVRLRGAGDGDKTTQVQARQSWDKEEQKREAAYRSLEQSEHAYQRKQAERRRRVLVVHSVLLATVLGVAEGLLLVRHLDVSPWRWGCLLLLSIVTTFTAVAVYQKTTHFGWFAVSAFLAIGVFQGFALHFDIDSNPKLEPAAALMPAKAPILGAYVAQTSDRLYLAVPRDPSNPR